jgi:DNA-binding MarR family transcriptional regulator
VNATVKLKAAPTPPFGVLFREFFQTFRAAAEERLRPVGYTFTQSMVLCYVDREPGITNAELARRAMVTPQSMGEVLSGLEKSDLLRRERHPDNARMQATYLTREGKAANSVCRTEMDKVDARMLELMSDAERVLFSKLLVRAMEGMRKEL